MFSYYLSLAILLFLFNSSIPFISFLFWEHVLSLIFFMFLVVYLFVLDMVLG